MTEATYFTTLYPRHTNKSIKNDREFLAAFKIETMTSMALPPVDRCP